MKSVIKRLIPKAFEGPIRSAYHATTDAVDLLMWRNLGMLLGKRDAFTPPKRLVGAIGGGSFEKIGHEFLGHFIGMAGLQPHERVLDVGCGSGRMAAPLTAYLTTGSYEGFDITPDTVRWCQRRITPRFPNFRFQLADVYSQGFNPQGRHAASEYRFPFESQSFDFVFLTSVFTHMLPKDMENYLSEVARVLKKGGRCLVTFFLLNDESVASMGRSELTFQFDHGGYRVNDALNPELAVAYPEALVRLLFAKYGLSIQSIRYGSWCMRSTYTSFQDIILATA